MRPFFWFEIFNVHESACNSVAKLDFLVKIFPSLKKPTFPTENCMVLVARFVLPL